MRRSQFESLRDTVQATRGTTRSLGIRLGVAEGRHAGRVGTIVLISGSNIHLEFEPENHLRFAYSMLNVLDAEGQPVVIPVTDMSNRVITEGAVIVYSVAAGRASHAMEVARVVTVNNTGTVTVKPTIHNGKRTKRYKELRVVNDPDRSLVMPVDLSLVAMWVLTDWGNFREDLD